MIEPLIILLAFVAGMIFRTLGFPPLLGYLLAGFTAHGLQLGDAASIAPIADIGITLLLFTIGLKLNLKELAAPQVWAVAVLQMGVAIPLTTVIILLVTSFSPVLAIDDPIAAWSLAFALSFSSTVFAVKVFEERGETASFHAQIAIGVLIVQDIIAVTYLVVTADLPPSPFAVALLALPLLRKPLLKLLQAVGHGELLVLFGICIALVMGQLFDWLHLKSALGALVAGVLIGDSRKSVELYKNLLNFKDLFLIGFFVQIGYNGFPSWEMLAVSCVLGLLLFIRPILYFGLFVLFKLRARTSLLAGLALFNYSEFGLIVMAIGASSGLLAPEWVTTLALALAVSFFISVPFNTRAHRLYSTYAPFLYKLERKERLAVEVQKPVGNAKILVAGMGRIGFGAYQYLNDQYPGDVIGIEDSQEKVALREQNGIRCVLGDATDRDFWVRTELNKCKLILVSLSNHQENLEVINLLKKLDFKGSLAVVARFSDEQDELQKLGCISFDLYAEAGHGFAEHVQEQLKL